ncbi:MAG: bifunctional oligoribonuclease/PAP phosphatase NrnA [Clostridiales bacterium]|nr:bifunctional oligoribonuclease/PAP phosphatase NrnA [Clostridiales bacterium]
MKQLAEFIINNDNFAVISHVSPDGDTMGSAAALLYALKKLNKKAYWVCEGKIPADYMKITEIASLVEYEKPKKTECAIAVDVSSPDRLGNCLELFNNINKTAQIDHHITNTNYACINVVKNRNACAFNVMELLDELNIEIDYNIARALFVGIMTDTGRLSHAGVTEQDVIDTSKLYAKNIDHNNIISTLFQTTTLKKVQLKGRAVEHIQTAFDNKVTYTYLDSADYLEFDADNSDSEGVIETMRSVEGTLIAFFIRQVPNGYKVSMRCTPEYDVSLICSSFGGGGHKLAAGCTIEGAKEDVINSLLNAIKEVL